MNLNAKPKVLKTRDVNSDFVSERFVFEKLAKIASLLKNLFLPP